MKANVSQLGCGQLVHFTFAARGIGGQPAKAHTDSSGDVELGAARLSGVNRRQLRCVAAAGSWRQGDNRQKLWNFPAELLTIRAKIPISAKFGQKWGTPGRVFCSL